MKEKTRIKDLVTLWKNYNSASIRLVEAMRKTPNEVGEFAETLVAVHYNAEQLPTSEKSADLITTDKKRIQVKSRKIEKIKSTQLGVIRSWDFDFLVVVLFSKDGDVLKAIKIDVDDAKAIAKWNGRQNGYILSTNKALLEYNNADNITQDLQNILDGSIN